MSTYYTSEELIESVKRRINTPINQNTFDDENILAFADEELSLVVVPAIISLHEDYLLFSQDVPLEYNKNEYEIPYRSVGNKLYDLQYVDNNGNVRLMSRTTMADQVNYVSALSANQAYSYYIKNGKVRLLPGQVGDVSGSLRFVFYIKPSSLVATRNVGVITNINTTTGEVTVSSLPTDFNTTQTYDFYKVRSPHNILAIDKTATAISTSSKTITFSPTDLPSELMVGDHVAISQQCAIPQIPSDLHVFLAQKTAERILEAQGDVEGLAIARQKSAEMEVRAGTIIDNRVEESPIKLSNRTGILRSGLLSRWTRRRR